MTGKIDIRSKEGRLLISPTLHDTSIYERQLMGAHRLRLRFDWHTLITLPYGAYVVYEDRHYSLFAGYSPRQTDGYYEYDVAFEAQEMQLCNHLCLYLSGGAMESSWTLTGTIEQFATEIRANLKRLYGSSAQQVITDGVDQTTIKTLTLDGLYLFDALSKIAELFECEWWYDGSKYIIGKMPEGDVRIVRLGEVGLSFTPMGDPIPIISRLYAFGGTKNLPPSYRNDSTSIRRVAERRLRLPNSLPFINGASEGRDYVKTFDEVYPRYTGTLSSVSHRGQGADLIYKVSDSTLQIESRYIIEGQTLRAIFESGRLNGMEFDLAIVDGGYELVPNDRYGAIIPNETLKPSVGDRYVPNGFDISLVSNEYIARAEAELQRTATEWLEHNNQDHRDVELVTNPVYCHEHSVGLALGERLILSQATPNGDKEGRITRIEYPLYNPTQMRCTIGDSKSYGALERLRDEAKTEGNKAKEYAKRQGDQAIQYTDRKWQDVVGLTKALEKTFKDKFSSSINPLVVRTMQLIAGDESLQFVFLESLREGARRITPAITYNNSKKTISIPRSYIKHMTLGITSISPTRGEADYKRWTIEAYTSPRIEYPEREYFLYAKVKDGGVSGAFRLSAEPIDMNAEQGYYNLLIGVLSVEREDNRTFTPLYGFSELLPGRITTDRIVSQDGSTYFDLVRGEIGGRIVLKNGRTIEELEEGLDGRAAVAHYAYADAVLHASDGSVRQVIGFSHTPREQAWLGHYTDYNTLDSGNPLDYRWLRVQGRDGAKGKDGAKGEKGDKGEDGSDGRPGRDGRDGNDGRPGADGQNGQNGTDGRSIVRTVPEYQAVDRAELSAIRSWAWQEEAPAWQYGKWLAVRWRIEYDRGADSYSEPYISLDWEVVGKVRQMAYLTEALQGSTQIDGGLLLTRLVGVASSNDYSDNGSRAVTAYLNGSHNPRPGDKGKRIAFALGVAHFGTARETRAGEIFHDGDVRFGNFIVGRNEQGENIALFVDPKTQDTSKPLIRIGGYQTALSQLMGQYTDAQTQTIRPSELEHKLRFSFGRWQREQEHKRVNIEGDRMTLKDGATATITGQLRVEISLARYCSAGSRNSLNMDRLTGFAAIRVEAYVTLGERKSLVGEYSCDLADTETCQEVDLPINLKHTGLKGGRYAPSIEVVAVVINPPKEVEQTIEVKPKGEVTFSARDVDPDVQEVVFSHRGISAFYGKNRFVYISNDPSRLEPVLSVRGLVDVPGVLFAMRVEVVSSLRVRILSIWGKYAPPDKSVGDYLTIDARDNAVYVGHTIGHTNYAISITSEKQDVISSYTHVERGGFWVRQRNLDDSKRGIKSGFSVVCTGYNYDITK